MPGYIAICKEAESQSRLCKKEQQYICNAESQYRFQEKETLMPTKLTDRQVNIVVCSVISVVLLTIVCGGWTAYCLCKGYTLQAALQACSGEAIVFSVIALTGVVGIIAANIMIVFLSREKTIHIIPGELFWKILGIAAIVIIILERLPLLKNWIWH